MERGIHSFMIEGYTLNDEVYEWSLSDIDKEALALGVWCIDNKSSIRTLAREFCMSKSTVYRRLQSLRKISYEMWYSVRKILEKNAWV